MSDDNSGGWGSRSRTHGDFADEISFVDLWFIFLKHKLLALVVFTVVMLLAAGFLLAAKPVFLSRSVVAVGHMPDLSDIEHIRPRVVEEPQLLVKSLVEEYKVNDKDLVPIFPFVYSVTHEKKSGEMVIELAAKGRTAEEAQDFLSPIVLGIVSRHKGLYDQAYAELEQMIESKNGILANIDKEADELQSHVDILSKNNLEQVSPFYMKLSLLSQQKVELLHQYDLLKANLDLKYIPTKILREPTLPARKHQPKEALIIAAAFVVGVFLAVLFVFVAEFLESVRKHTRGKPG